MLQTQINTTILQTKELGERQTDRETDTESHLQTDCCIEDEGITVFHVSECGIHTRRIFLLGGEGWGVRGVNGGWGEGQSASSTKFLL